MIDIAGATTPKHKLSISNVGVKDIVYPITTDAGNNSTAKFSMAVNLDKTSRGTHMSRFINILQSQVWQLSFKSLHEMHSLITEQFSCNASSIKSEFMFLRTKSAPVSKIESISNYEIKYLSCKNNNTILQVMEIVVPVTTLCPCSKAISEYGAHSQRTNIKVSLQLNDDIDIDNLINDIEQCGSAQLYSLLKREDEKYVTEHAYDNPMFVEDSVREVANLLINHKEIEEYCVVVESIESIHNHSAVARIVSDNFTSPEFF